MIIPGSELPPRMKPEAGPAKEISISPHGPGTADAVGAGMRNGQAAKGIQDDRRAISIGLHDHRVAQLVQENAQEHGHDPEDDMDRISQDPTAKPPTARTRDGFAPETPAAKSANHLGMATVQPESRAKLLKADEIAGQTGRIVAWRRGFRRVRARGGTGFQPVVTANRLSLDNGRFAEDP